MKTIELTPNEEAAVLVALTDEISSLNKTLKLFINVNDVESVSIIKGLIKDAESARDKLYGVK